MKLEIIQTMKTFQSSKFMPEVLEHKLFKTVLRFSNLCRQWVGKIFFEDSIEIFAIAT